MQTSVLTEAIELLEKSNAGLQPELLRATAARELMALYAKAEKLAAFGIAALALKLDDANQVAKIAGTSTATAKAAVTTGKALQESAELNMAMQHGEVSLDQASEIASAEQSCPGAAKELLAVAHKHSFHVLKDQARKTKLEAEQHNDLATRQHDARRARSYTDGLGMVNIHLLLEPHVGTPIVARAEAGARRIARKAKATGACQSFEAYLADAYGALLSGAGTGPAKRPELVVLVSHSVAERGWKDVRENEVCKIRGVGPVAPQIAKDIARDAFLSAVFYDGTDLRQFKRWSRSIPVEVRIALELGEPPSFDGVKCIDCGNRFRTEFDHVQPRHAHGPTSHGNLKPRCWRCHQEKTKQEKTKRDRRARRCRSPDL